MNISFLIANLGVRGSIRRVIELSNRLLLLGIDSRIYHSDGSPCQWLNGYAPTFPEEQVLADNHDVLIFFGDPHHWEMVKQANAKVKSLYVLGLNEKSDLQSALFGNSSTDSRTRAIRECLKQSDVMVMANCSAITEFFTSSGIHCYPVFGGVDFNLFQNSGSAERDPFMVLAGGSKRGIEGTATVLEIMEMVKKAVPDAYLETYSGKGYSQSTLADLYCRAGVFLDCQHYGGWNNPVAEAMACKTPVVCTDIWGNRDFAVNKVTALLSNDPVRLARYVVRCLTEPELVAKLTKAAHETIKEYTWERATVQLLNAIETEMSK